jgi:hypothetical protein
MTLGSASSSARLPVADTDCLPNDNGARSAIQEVSSASFLTSTATRPAGAYYVTPREGRWLVVATIDCELDELSSGILVAVVAVGGTQITNSLTATYRSYVAGANQAATQARQTVVVFGETGTIASGSTIEAMVSRLGGSGGGIFADSSKLVVMNIG